MATIDRSSVKLGFWVALGFFLFGLALAAAQWSLSKIRKAA